MSQNLEPIFRIEGKGRSCTLIISDRLAQFVVILIFLAPVVIVILTQPDSPSLYRIRQSPLLVIHNISCIFLIAFLMLLFLGKLLAIILTSAELPTDQALLIWLGGLQAAGVTPTPQRLPTQYRRPYRQQLFFDHLAKGQPIAQALSNTFHHWPLRDRSLLLANDSLAGLQYAIDHQLQRIQSRFTTVDHALTRTLGITTVLTFMFCTLIIALMAGPILEDVLPDYAAHTPPIAQAAGGFLSWYALGLHAPHAPFGFLLAIPGATWVTLALLTFLFTGEPLVSIRNWLALKPWALKIPLLGPQTRDRDWADIYALLAHAARQGVPFSRAIQAATLPDLNQSIARKLTLWRTGIDQGLAPAAASKQAGLPRQLAHALSFTHTNPGLANALSLLAHTHQSRAHCRSRRVRAFLPIALTLAIGFLTGLIILGYADAGRAVFHAIESTGVTSP